MDEETSTGSDGKRRKGRIARLNNKTASGLTDDGQGWNVSPGLLERIGA